MTSSTETEILTRSEGLLVAPFGDEFAVYDLVTDRVVLVDQVAGWLLQAGDEPIEHLVAVAAEATGVPRARVEADLRAGIAALADAGLLNRPDPYPSPVPLAGRPLIDDDRPVGATQAVLDQRLAFRSSDEALLREIEDRSGLSRNDGAPTLIFDVEPTDEGGVLLQAGEEWGFANRSSFFVQLPGVINDFASHTQSMLVLHAGAARTPDGRLLVLPGVPDAGKSTLAGALVQAGCDYLGDELIGVLSDSLQAVGHPRHLALDEQSRDVLGLPEEELFSPYVAPERLREGVIAVEGPAGAVTEILMPTYDPGTVAFEFERLAPREAIEALLTAIMNLDRCGEQGWRTLCQLAHDVPVRRVAHAGAPELARHLVDGDESPTVPST